METIRKGDIYFINLRNLQDEKDGTVIRGSRPVMVVQNEKGNLHSPNIIVIAVTSKNSHSYLPTHVQIPMGIANLYKDSVALTENFLTVERKAFISYIGNVGEDIITKVNNAIKISLALD